MALTPVRMTLTDSAGLSPAYTVPNGLKATFKSIQVTNTGAATAIWTMTLTGGFAVVVLIVAQNQTIVVDTAQVMNAAESYSILVTGASSITSVKTMISGVEFS